MKKRYYLVFFVLFIFVSCQNKSNSDRARLTLQHFMKARKENDTTTVNQLIYQKNIHNIGPEDPSLPENINPVITNWKVTGIQPASEKNDEFLFTIRIHLMYGKPYNIAGYYDELVAVKEIKKNTFNIVSIQNGNFYPSKNQTKRKDLH